MQGGLDTSKQYTMPELTSMGLANASPDSTINYGGGQYKVINPGNGTRSFQAVGGNSGGLSNPSSSDQVQGYLNDYHNLVLGLAQKADSPQQSDQEIMDQVKSNLLPNTPVPQAPNMTQEFQTLRSDPSITNLESKLTDLKNQESAIQTQTAASQAVENGKPVAQNVIQGRQTEEQQQATIQLNSIALQKAAVVDELTTRYSMIDNIMKFTQSDYDNALKSYQTQFSQNQAIYDAFTTQKNDQATQQLDELKTAITATGTEVDMAEKQAEFQYQQQQDIIKNASANLTIMANMITSGQTSYANMSPDQKLQVQKLEVQSGLGTGFIQNLTSANPNGKVIYAGANGAVMQMPDGSLKTVNYNVSAPTQVSETAQKQQTSGKVAQYLQKNANSYGNVSPAAWKAALNAWRADGYDESSFISNFSDFTDPNRGDFVNAYGFNPKLRGGKDSSAPVPNGNNF